MRWFDSITSSTDVSVSKLWDVVKDREVWHAAVHRVTKGQTWLRGRITMTSLARQNNPMKQSDCYCPILQMDRLRFRKIELLDQDHTVRACACLASSRSSLTSSWYYGYIIVWLFLLLFFNRLFFRALWAHSEIKGKAQKFPLCPLPPLRPSLHMLPSSFPGSSDGKESAWSAGDPGLIPA